VTDDEQKQALDRIEKDRRRREAELLALLLLLSDESEQHARFAIRTGNDSVSAARAVWLGDLRIDQPGAAPVLAEAMADVNAAGFRRGTRLAGASAPVTTPEDLDRLTTLYEPAARELAQRLWTGIELKLSPAVLRAQGQGVRAMLREIGLAFDGAGVSKDHARTIEVNVERAVVREYNAGMFRAVIDPKHHLIGFLHKSVLDDVTTTICRQRDGLKLAFDNPYWKTNFPPLHYGCRSVLMPLFGDTIRESTQLPTEPPADGFGLAPSADLGSYFALTR
jgi:SPP1 gp7 family putative phage head morphogenesis protein